MREQEIRKLSLKVRIYSVMLAVICAFWFMSTAVVLTTGAEGTGNESSVSQSDATSSATSSTNSSNTTGTKVSASDYQTTNMVDTKAQSSVSKAVASKNIKVKAGENVLTGDAVSSGVYFNVSNVSADDKKAVVALLKDAKITKNYVLFDFSLKYGNSSAAIQEGSMQITVNVPKEWKTVKGYDVAVYHYENKKLTKIKPSSVSDKGIVFETTGLSPFTMVRTSTGTEVENVKTGDSLTSTVAAIYLAAISIFMIAVVSIKLKVAKGRLDQVRRTAF